MIALLQRVTSASVVVDEAIIGDIKQGLLVFLGVEKNDTQTQADRLLEKILGYRMFVDEQDKMNLSVRNIAGGLLIVPQFHVMAWGFPYLCLLSGSDMVMPSSHLQPEAIIKILQEEKVTNSEPNIDEVD